MFLGMQDFDFTQISVQFCPNFALILPKFRPNLTKFLQKIFFYWDTAASPAPTALQITGQSELIFKLTSIQMFQ